jgi:hypothetical protein
MLSKALLLHDVSRGGGVDALIVDHGGGEKTPRIGASATEHDARGAT